MTVIVVAMAEGRAGRLARQTKTEGKTKFLVLKLNLCCKTNDEDQLRVVILIIYGAQKPLNAADALPPPPHRRSCHACLSRLRDSIPSFIDTKVCKPRGSTL